LIITKLYIANQVERDLLMRSGRISKLAV